MNCFNWTGRINKALSLTLAMVLLPIGGFGQQSTDYTFRAQTELVLVNVTVRDKSGNFVRDLKPDDFTILEDNKPQKETSFDIENTDVVPPSSVPQVSLLNQIDKKTVARPSTTTNEPADSRLKDRRLIVLFFDLSSMQPDDIERASTAALHYVDKQMSPADFVAVMSLGSSLTVNQDFTTDRDALKNALSAFNAGGGQGFEEGSTGGTEGTADTGQAFTVDDTEYNIFNTDRRLEALRSVAASLAKVDQKKSLIYFSSGMDRTGIENQSQLRAAINAAVRSNLAIYTMDLRGLQAMVPGGEAQNASLRGVAPYSGQSSINQLNSNFSSQETLVTLAGDTGGKAFLDSNDFGKVFTQVQQDTATYYMLGYHSTNTARDGKFRKITVRLSRPSLKLEYRKGYYAPADFKHSNKEDRELQLEEEMASDFPSTDLPVYLASGYFRLDTNRFYVPVSIVVPGSEIPFTRNSDQDKTTLDVLGVISDQSKRSMGQLRDTVKLAVNTSVNVQRKNVQYNSGFVLPAGIFHLKFVVRENQSGRLGSFETDVTVPDLKASPLRMSSVVLASQIQPAGKRKGDNPLVRDGSEVIPNVTHVFSAGQHLYLYYEVYDPAHLNNASGAKKQSDKSGIHLLTNVSFFQGQTKTYESQLVEANELNVPDRKAAAFQLDIPLTQLKPGFYTCQVNVIDDAGARFLFPRLALLVRQNTAGQDDPSKKSTPAE
jgi:VWFA-related protein